MKFMFPRIIVILVIMRMTRSIPVGNGLPASSIIMINGDDESNDDRNVGTIYLDYK